MNKLSSSLIFKITDYIGCKDYIRLYKTNINLKNILKENLDLKLPVFVSSVYDEMRYFLDGSSEFVICFDVSKNIETSISKLTAEKIREIINTDSENASNQETLIEEVARHIMNINMEKKLTLNFEGKGDYSNYERIIEIRVIPERYQILRRYINFSLSNYVFDKMMSIDKSDVREMIKLKYLVDNPDIFESHMENIKEYMK